MGHEGSVLYGGMTGSTTGTRSHRWWHKALAASAPDPTGSRIGAMVVRTRTGNSTNLETTGKVIEALRVPAPV